MTTEDLSNLTSKILLQHLKHNPRFWYCFGRESRVKIFLFLQLGKAFACRLYPFLRRACVLNKSFFSRLEGTNDYVSYSYESGGKVWYKALQKDQMATKAVGKDGNFCFSLNN